jgi:hypothetical protein
MPLYRIDFTYATEAWQALANTIPKIAVRHSGHWLSASAVGNRQRSHGGEE